MDAFYKRKKILVTGAAGTVGKAITRQLLRFNPAELRLLDNNESEIFALMEEYRHKHVFCFVGDIRDAGKIKKVARDVDIIIHAAAYKHVVLSEYNSFDAVQTNVIGVENIISAATEFNVKYVLLTSSDKAVNPTNVMGTTKLLGEKLMTAANAIKTNGRTIFSSTRFGNVIGSRGSVVPIFMRQIKKGGPVTITDEMMTRFIMTIEESAALVLKSLTLACGGEVFVTKMPIVRIADLATVMIDILAPRYDRNTSDISVKIIGAKPGEKLYEELMSEEEMRRSMELKDMFVITPAFTSIYHSIKYRYRNTLATSLKKSYISANEKPLTRHELKNYLLKNRVLDVLEDSEGH